MKKLLALVLALVMVLGLVACGKAEPAPEAPETEPTTEATAPATEATEETVPVETMYIGETEYWGVMAYALTPDGLYSRSDVFSFDPETKVAEISWILGQDNGIMQVYEGAELDVIGIELWNFSIGAEDTLKYSIDELKYVTEDGEIVLDEAVGQLETDMGDGTGGGPVADLTDTLFADVKEIHAKVTFIEAAGPQVDALYNTPVPVPEETVAEEQPASETDGWGVMVYFTTPDAMYSRSDVFSFDPETKVAEISWKLGQDNGVLQVNDDSTIDIFGIELWNFSLGAQDVLKYTVDELKYITADGEEIVVDAAGEFETDMGDGTGGGTVANVDEPAVSNIVEIQAKVTYVEKTTK